MPIADIGANSSLADYSMTSSARATNEGGTAMPRDRAVLKFIDSVRRVGSWNGRSATLAPSAVSLSDLTGAIGAVIGNASWLRESELLVLTRPRGAPHFKIRTVKPGQLRNHISGSSVDIHIVIDVKRLFDRIDHDWRAKFYSASPSAFAAALAQIEKQHGPGSVMKLLKDSKEKPKS